VLIQGKAPFTLGKSTAHCNKILGARNKESTHRMSAQYHRPANSFEPMSSSHNVVKPSIAASSTRGQPLRQRSLNVQNPTAASGISTNKPSSSSSVRKSTKSRENDEPIEIIEHRRKPNGEGHTVHRYMRGKMLGKGGFAKVYLCTSLDTNRAYAVKVVPKANLVKSRARQKVCSIFHLHKILGNYNAVIFMC